MDDGHSWDVWKSLGNHSKPFYIRFGKFVRLFIVDPVLVRQVLTSNADCYKKPSFIRSLSILGDGIFSSSGKDWFQQRKIFEPHFFSKKIKMKLELLREVTVEAMHGWEQNLQLHDQEIDIYQRFLELALSIFGKFAFGSDLKSSMNEIFLSFGRYLYNRRHGIFRLASPLPTFRSKVAAQQIVEDEGQLRRIAMDLLENELAHQHFEPDGNESLLTSMLLLLKEENLNEKQIVDNCITFLLVGHETTAILLTWTTYLLSVHPNWQEKARIEAAELWQKHDPLTLPDLGHLKTLNMILLESLRMYPPQPLIGRACIKENSVGEFLIPEKLEVVMPIPALHYSKEYWGDDPEEFRPERFANGLAHACKNPFTFLPFGTGPRTCIGQSFAFAEAKLVMAMMLYRFSWKISPHYRHCPDIISLTLRPSFGMPIIMEKLVSS
ncbi:cytochrome P450 CYP72A616 isoform X2 [Cryptomeria japonica]|nr:cytochrome P450 CYP72A616 isoform X2 [Cryptomeria japonica]XP_057822866.2 cytochrome P450 CYP72A616 isoform X2 [Cryptomeria japonica]